MAIVAQFWKGPADKRELAGIAESPAEIILKVIKPVKNEDYFALLARKLVGWY